MPKMKHSNNQFKNLSSYLDSIGNAGSIERLQAIASLNLGLRSDAAKRVIERRSIKLFNLKNNCEKYLTI